MTEDNVSVRNPKNAARWVFLGMLGLVVAGGVAYWLLRNPVPPPSPEEAADPLLMEGRTVYFARCAPVTAQRGAVTAPSPAAYLGRRSRISAMANGSTAASQRTWCGSSPRASRERAWPAGARSLRLRKSELSPPTRSIWPESECRQPCARPARRLLKCALTIEFRAGQGQMCSR